ncbi:MAG: hypothetical protein ACLPHP_15050 [Candidatus Sulfotelmatobacter sp.]
MTTPRFGPQGFQPLVFARISAVGSLLLLIVILLPQFDSTFGSIFGSTFSSPKGLLAAPAAKAKPYALIAGTVWGPDDHPVYGVPVKIRRAKDKAKKVRWEVYSDHMGEFAQRVPNGESDYILSADLKGFKTSDGRPLRLVKEVTVHIYNDEREDTGLHLTVDEPAVGKAGADKAGAGKP